jgi:GTP-binding protein Era
VRQTAEDAAAARAVAQSAVPAVLVFNKIDRLADRDRLLPLTAEWSEAVDPVAVFYVSAKNGDGIDALIDGLLAQLPAQPALFPPDAFTTESSRFLASEIVREQLLEQLHQEVPYGTTVVVEGFEEADERLRIDARVLVAEQRHKGIVIGRGGQSLKRIGTRARKAMQELFGMPVHLELSVGVERDWMDREQVFERLGYRR